MNIQDEIYKAIDEFKHKNIEPPTVIYLGFLDYNELMQTETYNVKSCQSDKDNLMFSGMKILQVNVEHYIDVS